METDWQGDYRTWMRERFPQLNLGLDELCAPASLEQFCEEVQSTLRAIVADTEQDLRERFTYISMIHSALYHHQKHASASGSALPDAFRSALQIVEEELIAFAAKIGVEHRFLSVFYLLYNPEIPDMNGRFAQFRAKDYETAFLRINREGTLQYKSGALALWEAYQVLAQQKPAFDPILSLLEKAANAFKKISHGNAMLLRTPGGEEFSYLTQYFGEVRVAGGPPLRGVNAGDQPWPFIIDLLLGVDLRNVFLRSFEGTPAERKYLSETHSNADVVRHEFAAGGYLQASYLLPEDYAVLEAVMALLDKTRETLLEAIQARFSSEEQRVLAAALHSVAKHYLAASNVHYQLARRYVPKNAEGEQIGSAGTNIVKFLKEGLNAERERVKTYLEERYPELLQTQPTETTIA